MKYDEVVALLGEFGPYQKRVYLLLCLPAITVCMQTLIYVFTMGVPGHRCAVPGLANDTYAIQNDYHAAIVNSSIPAENSCNVIVNPFDVTSVLGYDGQENQTLTDQLMFSFSSVANITSQTLSNRRKRGKGELENLNLTFDVPMDEKVEVKLVACSDFVYDGSAMKETIVTQMDLVCEAKGHPALAHTVLFVGSIVATFLCQPPSDMQVANLKFGRKRMLMVSIVLHAVASLAITWSTYFPLLCILMFTNGMAMMSVFANSFVIGIELVGPSKRVWAGYIVEIFWSLGMILLAPIAFLLSYWQHLQIATSIVPIAFISYYWLVPESPRWLLSKGRIKEAEVILLTAAKVNKVTLPARVLDAASLTVEKGEPIWSICKHPILVFRYAVIFLNWFVSSLAFYGLGLNVGSLSGSVYLNFFLSGVMELVAYALCICLLDRLGRRLLNSGLMLLAGVACSLTIFTLLYAPKAYQWTTTTLAMIGKLGISGGFATIWVYSSELFPTVVRSSGMGASSFCARIGSIISPYIASMSTMIGGDVGTATPLLIFGLSSILAGCLLLTLPETLNRRLPETLDDAVNFTNQTAMMEVTKGGYQATQQDETELEEHVCYLQQTSSGCHTEQKSV